MSIAILCLALARRPDSVLHSAFLISLPGSAQVRVFLAHRAQENPQHSRLDVVMSSAPYHTAKPLKSLHMAVEEGLRLLDLRSLGSACLHVIASFG